MAASDSKPVRVRWVDKYRTEADIRGTHQIVSDEPPKYGGEDAGPMPTDIFLASIASCMCQAIYHVARKQRLDLGFLEVCISGNKDPDAYRYSDVHLDVEADLPPDKLSKLVERARGYCFVSNTITKGCAVHLETQSTKEKT